MFNRRRFLQSASAAAVTGPLLLPMGARAALGPSTPNLIVDTASGKLRGERQGTVSSFKGIRYGASTADANRFRPPQKVAPWSGVQDALQLGPRCPQLPSTLIPEIDATDRKEPMGEDCLRLNVWTPDAGHARRRPVMVWLHGGRFSSGSGGFTIFDGASLAEHHDVVVVTLNHRLSAFGFLHLADSGAEQYAHASNLGLLDIVQALQWVHDNIAAFGGDAGNVTIFGQSGGGDKVSTLLGMPAARGLFHRAIIESATAIKALSREEANRSTAAFLRRLNLGATEVDRLRELSADQLLAAMAAPAASGATAPNFAPVIDGSALPADPLDPVAPDIAAHVPLLIGSTQDEICFLRGYPLDPIDEFALSPRLKQRLHATDDQVAAIIAAYRRDRPDLMPIDLAIEAASDAMTWKSTLARAERKAAQHAAPVYMYYFTWKSPVREGKLRSFHMLEIPFVFGNVDLGRSMTGTGRDRYLLQTRMSSAWTAFARTGSPDTPELPHWMAFDAAQRATMLLDNDCRLVNDPRADARAAILAIASD
jgi:para-nitrobenzyl esterase